MSKKPLTVGTLTAQFGQTVPAAYIAQLWLTWNSQRREKIEDWKEVRNYVFATDTTTTTNRSLPWKNSTTIPKLCQIRDNLHSNYISALFPNDDWLRWEAYSQNDATKDKRLAIQAYMANKCRVSHFRIEMSKLLYDYIDYGNCFATVDFEASFREDRHGNKVKDYVGPKVRRISPLDIVFNPIASSFKDSFKVVRSVRNIGELKMMAEDNPDNAYLKNAFVQRDKMITALGTYGLEESDKSEGFQMDGFGSYYEYLQSDYVELLEFYGDLYNADTGKVERGMKITVMDRMWEIQHEPLPSWFGSAPIFTAGWRKRPDNLWAMGPLDNLVGMQYRIDHLENLKADAMDLAVLPPLVIAGEVNEFVWEPGAEIHVDENGSVQELARNVQWVIQAENAIQQIEQRMEMYAGAPREAMGVRTPGEKTAFEVQTLENAASRIFQEKITNFEVELLEEVLNSMLETARRNLDGADVIFSMDNDLGVTQFMEITRDDITGAGVLRPIGARHFAAQAQLLQNLTGVFNSPIGQALAPDLNRSNLGKLVENVLGLDRYQLFQPNKAVFDNQQTQALANQAQENNAAAATMPVQGGANPV